MSCRHSPDEDNQATAAQIARTVEMLRKASNHDKQLWLLQLQKLTCKSPDVCELKSRCVEAYQEHLDGVHLIEQARMSAKPLSADAAADALVNALPLVEAAERQLNAAKTQTQACAENEAVIRQRYRL